jgi:predicted HicB family RNase H-like nuclease
MTGDKGPEKPRSSPYTIRVPPDTMAALVGLAKQERMSTHAFVVEVLKEVAQRLSTRNGDGHVIK